MKKTTMLIAGITAVSLIATTSAFAQSTNQEGYEKPDRAAIHEAIENNNYTTFQELTANTKLAEVITTQDQFERIQDLHDARKEGDHETAKEIAEELWFPLHQKGKWHKKRIKSQLSEEEHAARKKQKEAAKTAIENNDYNAFITAIAWSPLETVIDTTSEFELFIDMYEAKEAGDKETAKKIAEQLGIKRMKGKHTHTPSE